MTLLRRWRRRPVRSDAGSVTVEAALGIASLVVVLAITAAGAAAAMTQIRVIDAAREAARVAAMSGVPDGVGAGRSAAPGARVFVNGSGSQITAVVVAPARGLPGVELRGRAVARVEPGLAGATG